MPAPVRPPSPQLQSNELFQLCAPNARSICVSEAESRLRLATATLLLGYLTPVTFPLRIPRSPVRVAGTFVAQAHHNALVRPELVARRFECVEDLLVVLPAGKDELDDLRC